jgi:hypothetical protein
MNEGTVGAVYKGTESDASLPADKAEGRPKYQKENIAAGCPLSSYINSLFEEFKSSKKPFEDIAEECWYNFLGQYQSNLNWRTKEGEGNRSRIFIKITTLKCHTAHAKIVDAIGHKVPFALDCVQDIDYSQIPKEKLKEIIFKRSEILAKNLDAIKFRDVLDTAILTDAIFGLSTLKGPILTTVKKTVMRERNLMGMSADQVDPGLRRFDMEFVNEPVFVIDHVPWWEYYVDANAKSPKDSVGEIQFKRMLPGDFLQLADTPGYNSEAIKWVAETAVNSVPAEEEKKYIQLGDNYTGTGGMKDSRISVLEYQGWAKVGMLRDAGAEIPEGMDDESMTECMVVLAGDGTVIKAAVNLLGMRLFHSCPYKKRPHSIYGSGVAELMRDSQKMINSSARMIIDNKALSGNGMVEVNLARLDTRRTPDLSVYPRKVWYSKGDGAVPAVRSIAFPDTTMGLRELLELFVRFADEETGIPKYTSGEQDSFMNKTASGISMLMGQANVGFKTVMRNIDDFWIEPIVEAFDKIYMALGMYPQDTMIPLKVSASGTQSIIAREIVIENIMKLLQITANPQDAMFLKRPEAIREVASRLDLRDYVKSEEEINQILAMLNEQGNKAADERMRETVDMDRLYPFLTRAEQEQVLAKLGVQPSKIGAPITNPQQVGPVENTQGISAMITQASQPQGGAQ